DGEDALPDRTGPDVLVRQVDVVEVGELLPFLPLHPGVGDDEGAGGAGVRLQIPREGLDLGFAGGVVAAELVDAVLNISPDPGEFAGEVDGWSVAAVGDGVEGAGGEAEPAAAVGHVPDGAGEVARDALGDCDHGLDFCDRAGLLDRGGLADAVGALLRDGRVADAVEGGAGHAAVS